MRSRGFTLIELIVTLVIVGIVTAMAMPSFSELIKNSRLKTEIGELTAAMALARSEAIKRSRFISLCPRANDETCGTNSQNGWLLFVDATSAANAEPNGEFNSSIDEMLKIRSGLSGDVEIRVSGVTTDGYVAFNPLGNMQGIEGTGATFTLCDDRTGNYGRQIFVRGIGRPTVKQNVECTSS